MICKYCNENMSRHGDPGWHVCLHCKYSNRYNPPDPTQTIQEEVYVRHINDREYHLIIDYGTSRSLLYEYRRHNNKVNQELLKVDFVMGVNPKTVDSKIRTCLMFL